MNVNSLIQKIGTRTANGFLREIVRKRVEPSIFFSRGRANLGDSMVPWLIRETAGRDFPYSNPLQNRGDHLFSIGSILQYANADCHVWGSGFLAGDLRLKAVPRQITAVRGPLTAERLAQLGVACPGVYGDPALLTSRYVDLKHDPIPGRVGFIPHYVDWPVAEDIRSRIKHDVEMIDIRTENIVDFCRQVVKCEMIISSSLHGVIISECFGVPAVWCKIGDGVVGDGFKFHDYFKSTGRDAEPLSVQDITTKDVFKLQMPRISELGRIQDDLLGAFPPAFR